jgi:hypothetical protein
MVAHADNGTALIRPATAPADWRDLEKPTDRQLIMSLDHDHPEIVS